MKTVDFLPNDNEYDVLIDRVIDGDTVDALFFVRRRLRLDGVNAAPLKTELGQAARKFVSDRIEKQIVRVFLKSNYKFGGDERMAVIKHDDASLADELVAAGLAARWNGSGPRPLGVDE